MWRAQRAPILYYELKGAAYGLPQLGHAFHLHLCNKLDKIGYLPVSEEATLHIGCRKSDYVLFLVYVNDGLIGGKKELVEDLMGDITNEFDIEFKGPINGRTFLSREIEALKMHDLKDLKLLHMPVQPDIKYEDHISDSVHKDKYLAAVSLLIFIVPTCPDVQFAIGIALPQGTRRIPAPST
ncbi:hypothetical protein JCM3770_002397 [Rhodotorula araucariae]